MGEKVSPNLEQPEALVASETHEGVPVNEWGDAPLSSWPPVENSAAEE